MSDVRCALRTLTKNPGFSLIAVLTLAIGIGVNAAVFAVTNAVLFKGSGSIDRTDRIVFLGSGGPCCVSLPDFEDWQSQATSFEGMAAVADLRITLSDTTGIAETNSATQVTADTFRLIGRQPIIGRDFVASDMTPGAQPVAILSYGFWERRYAKDPAVIGQTLRINGMPTTVIGVMPRGVTFPQKQDLWLPLIKAPDFQERQARRLWFAFGRLANGISFESARSEMEIIGRRLAGTYPQTNDRFLPVVMTFRDFYVGPHATAIYASMWGAVAFVLLIACTNLAHLFLARAVMRDREISVRLALGAGRWRIIRQPLIESVMLSLVGGACGWWGAKYGVRVYGRVADVPTLGWSEQLFDYSLDYSVFAYVIAISIGTGLAFGIAPAFRLLKQDINAGLKAGGRGGSRGTAEGRLSSFLVVGEIALAVVLLSGAGVMTRSFLNVYWSDIGANTSNVLTMFLSLPGGRYGDDEAKIAFFDGLIARLHALPGVDSVAIAWRPPTSGSMRLPYDLSGAPAIDEARRPALSAMIVSSGYFQTLGARVLSGRDFNRFDGPSGIPVAIVNERFASLHWPGEPPLGKQLRVFDGHTPGVWLTVVGVVSNVVQNNSRQEFDPLVYLPYRQRTADGMWVFARTRVPPSSLASGVRHELQMVDPDMPIWIGPFTLNERLAAIYWNRGLYGGLFAIFAAIALLLASLGLYAVVAQSVGRRTREIGVRMAMGASVRDVLVLIFKQGMLPAAVGLVVGLGASLALNRVLQAQLVGVSPGDPAVLTATAVTLLASAAIGCYLPARRAARVDPLVALREE